MSESDVTRAETGIPGLDEILHGGLIPRRTYLVWGGPGTGKTTLGVHFLRHSGDGRATFITLGETEAQLRDNAERVGLSLDGIDVLDLSPADADADAGSAETYDLLEAWEVEGTSIHDRIVEHAREHAPVRVFIDSLSQLRYLTPDTFQFRKQVLSLLRQLTAAGATVLLTAEMGAEASDDDLQFLSDGVIRLERVPTGRVCRVTKMRGSDFQDGGHYYALGHGGMIIYPRLVPARHGRGYEHESVSSGVAEIDALTNGGIERGTITMLTGPSGVGKTSLGAQFIGAAAARGERSVIYNFDESRATFEHRCKRIGLPIARMLDSGQLLFEEIEPLHYNPDQFAFTVREEVERRGVRIVMIDSLSGYRQSVRGEDLVERVHALCRYLVNMGITVIVVNEVHSVAGQEFRVTEHGMSYLADTIIMLRYLELDGELRKCIGMLKKRTGDFEKSLREFDISADGLRVGEPLRGLRGVLRGVPEEVSSTDARNGKR